MTIEGFQPTPPSAWPIWLTVPPGTPNRKRINARSLAKRNRLCSLWHARFGADYQASLTRQRRSASAKRAWAIRKQESQAQALALAAATSGGVCLDSQAAITGWIRRYANRLAKAGWVREHKSDSSWYFSSPRSGQYLRVSDHLVPQTDERDYYRTDLGRRPPWTSEVIVSWHRGGLHVDVK